MGAQTCQDISRRGLFEIIVVEMLYTFCKITPDAKYDFHDSK